MESAHHPVGQQITGLFEDVSEPAKVVSYELTPAFLQDRTIAEGGTGLVKSVRQSLKSSAAT